MFSGRTSCFAWPMRILFLVGLSVYGLALLGNEARVTAAEPALGQVGIVPAVAQTNLTIPAVPSIAVQPVSQQVIASPQLPQKPLESPPQQPAAPPAVLTLKDLESIALQNNPSLAESAARVNALRGKWEQVGLAPNPYAGYSGQQVGSGNTVEQRGVVFGQEFITDGKLQLNRATVSQEVQRAEQLLAAQNLRVLTDVRIGYYDVLTAQQRSLLAQQIAQSSTETISRINKLIEFKLAARTELLQATIELESALILKQRSDNQYLEAWRKLAAVLGTATMQPQPLQGNLEADLPRYEWESSLSRLLSSSPEICAAQAEIQRARTAYQRAVAEKTPNISFQGIVQYDQSINAPNGAVQVTFPLPLWNKNQGAVTQTSHEALAAERALNKLELDLQHRLATVFQRYATASHQIERYNKAILPAARENMELVHRAFQGGEYDYLKFLIAQRTYSQINFEYLNALQEVRIVGIEIEGMLLTNSLQSSSGN